ncbi:MAG: hypothetical protein QXV20_06180 [Candidatus Hadarchaeales archaeon]
MTVNVDALMEVMNVMRSIVELTKRGVIGWVISDVMENGVVFKSSLSPYTFTLSVQVVPYMSKVLVVQSENQPAAPPLSLAQIFSFTVKENETVVLHHTVDPNTTDPVVSLIKELYTQIHEKVNNEAPARVHRLRKTLEQYLK